MSDLVPEERLRLAHMHYDLRSFSADEYRNLFPGLTQELTEQDLDIGMSMRLVKKFEDERGGRFQFS
ncbi:MAG: hypothetical protein AAF585_00935 [Verrucomicrobiota bacterium]